MRSDDGIGIYVAQKIAAENNPNVKVCVSHQLHIEMLEEAVLYDKVILVDAAAGGEEVVFRKVDAGSKAYVASSHHLSPELFFNLAEKIYRKNINLYACSIKGESFELGNTISPIVYTRAEKSIDLIHSLINKDLVYA